MTKKKAPPSPTETGGPERRAAARALYESTVGITLDDIAAQVGVETRFVRRWKLEDGWRLPSKPLPEMSGKARDLADRFTAADPSAHPSAAPSLDVAAGPVDPQLVREFSTDVGAEVRAEVLARHRKEWQAPRSIAYNAIKKSGTDVAGAFELAKLARITADTLTLIHAGECRAFGLDMKGLADANKVVIVERGSDGTGDGTGD